MGKEFLNCQDLMTILGFKESKCRMIIRALNAELEKNGYFTARGRVPAVYFRERFGLPEEESDPK